MRAGSEEPPTGVPIPNASSLSPPTGLPPSLPPSPTPQARSPPSQASTGGVPLTLGGVQRKPSVKARDAFNRLRIGSFGANPDSARPVVVDSTAARTLSPDDWDRSPGGREGDSPADLPRSERNSSAPPTSQPYSAFNTSATATLGAGMSPAASFLSSFSPTSAPTSSSYASSPNPNQAGSPHHQFSRRLQMGRTQDGGGLNLLPPKGDEQGFVLPLSNAQILGETEMDIAEDGEWVLGKELGSGGMGVVREVVWRPTSSTPRLDSTRRSVVKRRIAVKIVRKDLFSAGGSASSAAGSALEAFGLSPRGVPPPSSSGTGSPRPLPGSRAASFQLALPPSSASTNAATLRNPSKDRLLGSSFPAGALERNRSTSSPIKPPSQLFPSSERVTGSLSPIEQSPLPSPGLADVHSPTLEVEPSLEQSLLLALLNRELTLWSHITADPSSTNPASVHPHIVPLLSTFEQADFSYVFMPLCDGGSLLSYLNSPPSTRDEPPPELTVSPSTSDRDSTPSTSSSRSRDRAGPGSSSSRGRSTLPRAQKARTSLPFASSIGGASHSSPSTSLSSSTTRTSRFLSPPPQPQERALSLENAGIVFEQIVSGLRWLHEEKGVVHKDFKLENLLSVWERVPEAEGLVGDDEAGRGRNASSSGQGPHWRRVWKLADFGLAEIIPPSHVASTAASPPKKPTSSPAVVVPPLSTLARGGSLNRPNKHSQLSLSLGPSSSATSSAAPGPGSSSGQASHASKFKPSHHSSILVPPLSSSESLAGHLHPIGSLPYSSPESLRSPIPILHPSVDIWALGCVLYAMIEGVLPIWDEWEFRLRTRLIKGDWEVPENLAEVEGEAEEVRREKKMVLEVLSGCLEKNVEARWSVARVADSDWLRGVRGREEDKRRRAEARANGKNLRSLQLDTTVDSEMTDSVLDLPPSPARGRPSTLRPLLPALSSLSCASSTASSTPASASTSTSRSSSSRSLPRSTSHSSTTNTATNNRPSPVLQDALSLSSLSHSQSHPTLRRPSRSTSRSSAYSHQGVDARTQMEELKERGRSQRRLRWDEEKETSRRRRSESRDALEGAASLGLDDSLGITTRGRSSSRSSLTSKASGKGKSRERGAGAAGSGERLETVRDEPY
ncbi:hypothetical protein JCM3766R1_004429 [Sporobolomyces carnicolor]